MDSSAAPMARFSAAQPVRGPRSFCIEGSNQSMPVGDWARSTRPSRRVRSASIPAPS